MTTPTAHRPTHRPTHGAEPGVRDETARTPTWLRGAGWLGLSVVALSVSNYVFSLSMTRLLPRSSFVEYVGLQSLLLVIGTGVMAAVPWVMAREVARASGLPADAGRRVLEETVGFGLAAAAVQGLVVAVVAAVVGHHVGGPALAAVAGAAAFAVALVAAPVGLLQGQQRFATIAGLRLGEGVVRIGSSLLLVVLVSASAPAALLGLALGSTALVVSGLLLGGRGLRPARPRGPRVGELTRRAVRLGLVQILLTLIASVDAVVAALTSLSGSSVYAYQTAALLGRAPLFVAIALAQALYPVLSAAADPRGGRELRRAVGVHLRIGLIAVVGAATVPAPVLAVLAGGAAPDVAALLRLTVVSGVLVGLCVVLATVAQAQDRLRGLLTVLVVAAVLQPLALVLASAAGALAFAATGLAAIVLVTLATWRLVRGSRPLSGHGRRFWAPFVLAVPVVVLLLVLQSHPLLWGGAVALWVLAVLRELRHT